MPSRGICEFCGNAVMTYERAAYPVSGWEVERSAGGTNHLKFRKRQGERIAHAVCLDEAVLAERRGISRGQGTLV